MEFNIKLGNLREVNLAMTFGKLTRKRFIKKKKKKSMGSSAI